CRLRPAARRAVRCAFHPCPRSLSHRAVAGFQPVRTWDHPVYALLLRRRCLSRRARRAFLGCAGAEPGGDALMETAFALLIGIFAAAGIYLLLSRQTIRMVLGIALFGNAVNLILFTAGRVTREVPPVIPADAMVPVEGIANP